MTSQLLHNWLEAHQKLKNGTRGAPSPPPSFWCNLDLSWWRYDVIKGARKFESELFWIEWYFNDVTVPPPKIKDAPKAWCSYFRGSSTTTNLQKQDISTWNASKVQLFYLVRKRKFVFGIQIIISKMNLNSIFQTNVAKKRRFLDFVSSADFVDRFAVQTRVKVASGAFLDILPNQFWSDIHPFIRQLFPTNWNLRISRFWNRLFPLFLLLRRLKLLN